MRHLALRGAVQVCKPAHGPHLALRGAVLVDKTAHGPRRAPRGVVSAIIGVEHGTPVTEVEVVITATKMGTWLEIVHRRTDKAQGHHMRLVTTEIKTDRQICVQPATPQLDG